MQTATSDILQLRGILQVTEILINPDPNVLPHIFEQRVQQLLTFARDNNAVITDAMKQRLDKLATIVLGASKKRKETDLIYIARVHYALSLYSSPIYKALSPDQKYIVQVYGRPPPSSTST
uniref:AlNc14C322G10600 protein n=1 Tax=Albugo laibachii Nc14 TaxID=890382 RepID=F0WWI9_9STRA|nr:AlNc14C322G10600 [Albugo laibachii Nc14]|eukprot:CCA25812.1 AlNc14C322G10600 [Albugo laibachii Nc14]